MTEGPVFTSRLTGRQLLDSEDLSIGRVRDVVILPAAGGEPPWVIGLVVTLQRRQIFVNLGRVAEISIDGAHLRGGAVDLRRFSRRTGEILASELYGKRAGAGTVRDVGHRGIRAAPLVLGGLGPGHRPRAELRWALACGTTTRRSCRGTSTRSCSR